jgi:hypothetical protein
VRLEGLGKLKKSISSGIEPTTCSIVPQPTTLPRAPDNTVFNNAKDTHPKSPSQVMIFRKFLRCNNDRGCNKEHCLTFVNGRVLVNSVI